MKEGKLYKILKFTRFGEETSKKTDLVYLLHIHFYTGKQHKTYAYAFERRTQKWDYQIFY